MRELVLCVVSCLVALICFASTLAAQESGDMLEIAIPADVNVTTGADGDKVVYVGRAGAFVDARDCASEGDLRPFQQVVIVDAGSGARPARTQAIVTLTINGSVFHSDVRNGTRVGTLSREQDCTVGGVAYFRYRATVE